MAKSSLYDINAELLFEQKSINEIEQIRIKLQHEIEKKREELRTMVGERYRDLIQAADTIAEMKHTAANVVNYVREIKTTCENSHERGFFKLQIMNPRIHRSVVDFSQKSIAAQIQILIIVPEKIWMCIENEDFLGAVELYLFAQYISTGLQFRINDEIHLDKNLNWTEVAQRQWNMISSFKDTIKNACNDALKSSDIKSESAVQCLCTLSLLQDTPLSNILNAFIDLRIEALDVILNSKDEQYNVKTRVTESASLLINTLYLIHECFIGEEEPLISVEFNKILKSDILSVIKDLSSESLLIERVLGDDILSFKPSLNINAVTSQELNQSMNKWLREVEQRVNKDLVDLINLVNSVKSLQGIRLQLLSIEKPVNWQEICKKLSVLDMLDIFITYYQPSLTSRIEYLINLTWTKAIACIKTDIKKIVQKRSQARKDVISWQHLENVTESDYQKSKPKLSSIDDLEFNEPGRRRIAKPIVTKSLLENKSDNLFTLINVYGFDNDMIKSCRMFDKCLKTLLDDVYFYLNSKSDSVNSTQMDDNSKIILKFMHDCSSQHIKSLIEHIEKQYLIEETCLILSRYLKSVMHLCPNLSKCFSKDLEVNAHIFDDMTDLDMKLWQCWLDSVDMSIQSSIDKSMPKELSSRIMLNVLSQWETVTIQEKDDEQNKTIDSNIRIPIQTSFPLQTVLCSANARLAQVASHLMPDAIRKKLIKSLNHKILQQYESYLAKDDNYIKSNQVTAVQFYFDVKYLQTLTSGNVRDEPGFQNVGDALKKLIDPFDFDVFYPHLQRNVKRAVQKTQVQLGCLVGNAEQLNALLASTPNVTNSIKQEIACVLPLVSSQCDSDSKTPSSYWFTLLPITSTGSRTVESTNIPQQTNIKPQVSSSSNAPNSKSSNSNTSNKPKQSTSKLGAASFFGAMGQEWFGTY
uniref:Conserved oligomeric Golgi complex subunit 1 n=1 Tax=Xenopsylla cheopis TaxID=163159 RepID=A0A6M2DMV3_XENCH